MSVVQKTTKFDLAKLVDTLTDENASLKEFIETQSESCSRWRDRFVTTANISRTKIKRMKRDHHIEVSRLKQQINNLQEQMQHTPVMFNQSTQCDIDSTSNLLHTVQHMHIPSKYKRNTVIGKFIQNIKNLQMQLRELE